MIELKGITWDHPRGYDPLQASAKRYWRERGIRVSWQKRTLKDFGDTSVDTLAQNFDLLVIDHPHMGSVAATGSVVNLADHLSAAEIALFAQQSVGPSFGSYHYNKGLWALPVDAACQAAAFRPYLLPAEALPATWPQVIGLAENLRTKNQWAGVALCATDCNCIFLTLSAQRGNPVAQTGEELIPLEAGLAVLQLMKELKRVSHPDSLHWNPIQLYDHMTSANDVVYSPIAFAYCSYAASSSNPLRYASLPGGTHAVLGGAGMAVSAKTKFVNEAVDYLRWICDPVYQQTHYRADGGQPGQLSAWIDPGADAASGNFYSSVLPVIRNAYVRPQASFWPPYQEWLGETVHQYLAYNLDPVNVIHTLNAEYKNLFSKNDVLLGNDAS